MAFRILNEKELLLLTGQQREQYEKEYDIYKKRVAFVEQMEKYESVEIKPFQTKLDFTFQNATVDIKPYHQQEYKVKMQKPSARPKVQVRVVKIDTTSKPKLPDVSIDTIKNREIRKIKNPTPLLPAIYKPSKFDRSIKKFDKVQIKLPETRQTHESNFRQIHMENVHVHISEIAPQLQLAGKLRKNIQVDFSKRKPEVKLPEVDMPRANFPDVHTLPKQRDLKLPDIQTGQKVRIPESTVMTERNAAALFLPEIQKPEIHKIREFQEIRIQIQEKEKIHLPEVKTVTFIQPDINLEEMPMIKKPNVKAKDFQTPQIHIQPLEKTRVKAPVLNELQTVKVEKVEPPVVKSVDVRQVLFPDVCVNISPGAAVKVPDTDAVLEKFFKENTEKEQEGIVV